MWWKHQHHSDLEAMQRFAEKLLEENMKLTKLLREIISFQSDMKR